MFNKKKEKMKKERRTAVVGHKMSDVRQFLSDIRNYSTYLGSACRVDPNGKGATIQAPMIGQIRATLSTNESGVIILSSGVIGTTISADLSEISSGLTSVTLTATVNPRLGLIKDSIIESMAPRAIKLLAEKLTQIKIDNP